MKRVNKDISDSDCQIYNISNFNSCNHNLKPFENVTRSNVIDNIKKQNKKEIKGEQGSLLIKNVNVSNQKNSFNSQEDESSGKECTQENVNINSSSLAFSASDDEALEDYLNVLAKNYENIDRRIKNAERFVNQIDDPKNTECLLKKGFKNVNNYCSPIERFNESKVKYVTELRVNIANSLKNNKYSDSKECCTNNNRDFHDRSSTSYDRPAVKKRSTIPKMADKSKTVNAQDKKAPICFENCEKVKSDLEEIIIPPPKMFNSNKADSNSCVYNKEVQTLDSCAHSHNISFQSMLENRAVQTVHTENCYLKTLTDIGVGTDVSFLTETFKTKLNKSESDHISLISNRSDNSESFRTEQFGKSFTNENTERSFEVLLKEKNLKSSTKEFNGPRKKQHYNIPEKIKYAYITDAQLENSNKKNFSVKKKEKQLKNNSDNLGNYPSDFDFKDGSRNASKEIQRLLENLGSQLQATMTTTESKIKDMKHEFPEDGYQMSFWDNPLQKKEIPASKILYNNSLVKQNPKKKPKSNVINSELQEICRTIQKNIKSDKHFTSNQNFSESEKNIDVMLIELENGKLSGPSYNSGLVKTTLSSANVAGDVRLPHNFKFIKTFNLNPYDDIIKSYLSSIDRRLKSVASKNDCIIIVDGPINVYDTSSPQTFRNKLMYRCTIGAAAKENVDKCVNYLKETFPNTYLKTNSRAG